MPMWPYNKYRYNPQRLSFRDGVVCVLLFGLYGAVAISLMNAIETLVGQPIGWLGSLLAAPVPAVLGFLLLLPIPWLFPRHFERIE